MASSSVAPPPAARRRASSSDGGAAGLGAWLTTTRGQQRISQRALAERASISRSYLCDIEHGRATPTIAILDRIARALGAPREELLVRAAGAAATPAPLSEESAAEHRLLAIYRALSPEGRQALDRFARFTHTEEQRWVQGRLVDDPGQESRPARQTGPGLFDGLLD